MLLPFLLIILVAKRLAGGQPAKIGDRESRCLPCAPGKPLVALRCQASWCLRGAQGQVANGVSQGRQVRQAGGI